MTDRAGGHEGGHIILVKVQVGWGGAGRKVGTFVAPTNFFISVKSRADGQQGGQVRGPICSQRKAHYFSEGFGQVGTFVAQGKKKEHYFSERSAG